MSTSAEKTAKIIYNESQVALMAHSIRGAVNYFRKREHRVDLGVWVIADLINRINLNAPEKGLTSILETQFVKGVGAEFDRLIAKIYIHRDANKHLARICIAHELYHLLLELWEFEKRSCDQWPKIQHPDPLHAKKFEDDCNLFALDLCRHHDSFYRNNDLRDKHTLFPTNSLQEAKNMHRTDRKTDWPRGIGLDPTQPFYKPYPDALLSED